MGGIGKKRAYERLSITPASIDAMPSITPQLKKLDKLLAEHVPPDIALTGPYYYLHCSDAPEARLVLDKYYDVPLSTRKSLPIEAFCAAASVSTLKILEIVYGTAARIAQQDVVVAAAIAANSTPKVVEYSLENAAMPGIAGFGDRQMLAKITGLIPQPRGTSIKVVQNANATAISNATAVPAPEATIRRLVDRFNERRSPSPSTTVIDLPLEDD